MYNSFSFHDIQSLQFCHTFTVVVCSLTLFSLILNFGSYNTVMFQILSWLLLMYSLKSLVFLLKLIILWKRLKRCMTVIICLSFIMHFYHSLQTHIWFYCRMQPRKVKKYLSMCLLKLLLMKLRK